MGPSHRKCRLEELVISILGLLQQAVSSVFQALKLSLYLAAGIEPWRLPI